MKQKVAALGQLPWYSNQAVKFTKPQEALNDRADMREWYPRGQRKPPAEVYRAGACENCGAMGHKKKDCTERMRKVGAKFSNREIKGDDIVWDFNFTYDGKRDRWNGFDPSQYREVEDEFAAVEQLRKQRQKEQGVSYQDEKEEFEKEFVHGDLGVEERPWARCLRSKNYQKAPKNLRRREDTVKYLLNRDLSAPYFDPKSRAMKEDPDPENPGLQFRGQAARLNTGEMPDYLQLENFAFQHSQQHSLDLNATALPTLTSKIYRSARQIVAEKQKRKAQELQKVYGNEGKDPVRDVVSSEVYVQYTRDCRVKNLGSVKSRYPEDMFPGDHSSVWGSWWNEEMGWGYACCHSNKKASPCLGQRGWQAAAHLQYKLKKQRLKVKQEEGKEPQGKPSIQQQRAPSSQQKQSRQP